MKTLYLAQMKWCEREEPICVGTNKRKLLTEALRRLKLEHGTGPVCRGQAMCRVPIAADDVEISPIPFLSNDQEQEQNPVSRTTREEIEEMQRFIWQEQVNKHPASPCSALGIGEEIREGDWFECPFDGWSIVHRGTEIEGALAVGRLVTKLNTFFRCQQNSRS